MARFVSQKSSLILQTSLNLANKKGILGKKAKGK